MKSLTTLIIGLSFALPAFAGANMDCSNQVHGDRFAQTSAKKERQAVPASSAKKKKKQKGRK